METNKKSCALDVELKMSGMLLQVCNVCKIPKELQEFRKCGGPYEGAKGKYQKICKKCISAKIADTRAKRNSYGKYGRR